VLLGDDAAGRVERLVMADDAFAMGDAALAEAAHAWGAGGAADVFEGEQALFLECYRVLQGAEIWQGFGPWVLQRNPRFAPDIAARFADAAGITPEQVAAMGPVRARIMARVRAMVPPGTALVLPTTPGPALRLDASDAEIGAFYRAALALTSIAGHAGLPQVTIPAVKTAGGCPLGLSVIGWAGADRALLRFAAGVGG
jgi:amidase